MTFSRGLCEFAGGNALSPVRGLQVVEVALRNGNVVVIVLELISSVTIEEPVKHLLVVWSVAQG